MIDSQTAAHSAKHAGINLGLYAIVCLVLVLGYIAVDTHGFTKPPSWWQAGVASAGPALSDYKPH